MATILLTGELGSGWGHHARLSTFRGLTATGHQVFAAVRDANDWQLFLGPAIRMFTAPRIATGGTAIIPHAHSFAHLLHNVGFGDAQALKQALQNWRLLYEEIRPDIIVADHSPTALLAARGAGITRILIGTGFTVPRPETPFRNLRHWSPLAPATLIEFELQLLEIVNQVLRDFHQPLLSSLSGLYTDVEYTSLQTYRELDPYGERSGVTYDGICFSDGGGAPRWPSGRGPRVFAYLKEFPALEPLLKLLRDRRFSTIVVCNDIQPQRVQQFASDTLRIETLPIELGQVSTEAELAILNGGHGATAAMLLAGTPILQLPVSLERTLNAHHSAKLDAAICCPPDNPRRIAESLEKILSCDRWTLGAKKFAQRYADLDFKQTPQRLTEIVATFANQSDHAS